MPNLRDIKRRIRSVQKTQQITRAMRMVAAAKLRRAEEQILAARPYAERMNQTLAEVARRQRGAEHPLLVPREQVRRLELLVVTSDRGLCGAFNANILKYADGILKAREPALESVAITPVGRKARDYFGRRRPGQLRAGRGRIGKVEYRHAARLAGELAARYEAEEIDEAVLVFSEFVTTLTQRPRQARLLPLAPPAAEAEGVPPYTVEPDEPRLLAALVPRALEVALYRALLENQAGEHAARMTAMESATRNTEEMIDTLTLQYNRARQAAITKELVDIITGAEAL